MTSAAEPPAGGSPPPRRLSFHDLMKQIETCAWMARTAADHAKPEVALRYAREARRLALLIDA